MTEDLTQTAQLPGAASNAVEEAPSEQPVDDAELRMRRALNLMHEKNADDVAPSEPKPADIRPHPFGTTSARRPPRRFVKEGEVPTTILRGRREAGSGAEQPVTNRLAAAEAAADAERLARERAEQAHREAVETIRRLETRQKHIELARDEALAALKASDALLESLHQALRSHQEQLAAAETAIAASEQSVRAGMAALSREQAARTAAEAALQDALSASEPRKTHARPKRATRSASAPVRKSAASSRATKGQKAKASTRRATRTPIGTRGKAKARVGTGTKTSTRASTHKTTRQPVRQAKTPSRLRPVKTSGRTGSSKAKSTRRTTPARPSGKARRTRS